MRAPLSLFWLIFIPFFVCSGFGPDRFASVAHGCCGKEHAPSRHHSPICELTSLVPQPLLQEQAEAAEGDFKALERMRTMALQARAATDASVATLQAYYAQVDRLHGIFPINPDHIRVAFTWHDAFRPTKKSTEMDLNFERAGVLFNMGAVKSNIAASADRTSAEGVKLASREFQLAAGLFKYLREHVVSQLNCSLPSELTQEGLLMVENIMLAQVRGEGKRIGREAERTGIGALYLSLSDFFLQR